MLKSKCVILCFCYMIIGSYAGLAPFIEKCEWHNKACLIESSKKAISYFAKGMPQFGVEPLDPLVLSNVVLEEGDFKMVFKEFTVKGASKAKVINVERNLEESYLLFEAEIPIDVSGTYSTSGKFGLFPIEGDGPFTVKSDKVLISVKVGLSYVDGPDGEKHWQTGKVEHTFDFKEKAFIKFENLFNGDKEKAEPVNAILDQNWKEIIHTLAKKIFVAIVKKVIDGIQAFLHKIPAYDLEIVKTVR